MIAEFEQALQGRIHQWGVMDTADLRFYEELIQTCATNVCGNYNKCWTCPPAVGSLEDQQRRIHSYQKAFIFTTLHNLEDSFDFEGMQRGKDLHNALTAEMHDRFGKTNPVYGAGGCSICPSCAYPDPCRFPDRAYSAIEAAGIHVTELSRSVGVRYHNGEHTVTYFSMILCNG